MGKRFQMLIEADSTELFDALAKLGGNTSGIGDRVVGGLMTGNADWKDEIGLAAYGVTIKKITAVDEARNG